MRCEHSPWDEFELKELPFTGFLDKSAAIAPGKGSVPGVGASSYNSSQPPFTVIQNPSQYFNAPL